MEHLSWNRFGLSHAGLSWKHIYDLLIGFPTEEERQKILDLGLYELIIDPDDIVQFPELEK